MDGPTYGSYSFRRVTFQSVLFGAIRRTGVDPTTLSAVNLANACEFLQSWVKKAWEWEFWPELTVLEQRAYRDAWDAGTDYVASAVGAPTEVWYAPAQQYAQALQASTNQLPFIQLNGIYVPNYPYWELSTQYYSANPWATGDVYAPGAAGIPGAIVVSPLNNLDYECIVGHTSSGSFATDLAAGYWGLLTTFEKYVSLDQDNQTPIGEVHQVSRSSPRLNPRFPGVLQFIMNNRGIYPAPMASVQVWVLFRLRPPQFTTDAYASGTTYGIGDVVYEPTTTGECYVSRVAGNTGNTPETSPDEWELQPIPELLAETAKLGTHAELLRSDGQNEKADDVEGKALEKLTLASDVALASQGQFERANAQVYC